MMAMLAGMQGVRSAVCSQVALHPVVPTEGKIAAALHLPTVLDSMGVHSLDAYTDDDTSWAGKLIDAALNLGIRTEGSACKSAVCHRLQALFGMPYEHENLSQLIHDNLHELFGVTNLELMKHIALMVRDGHAVSRDGEDTYMPHLERLAIPIKFLFGNENKVYVPLSTERTYDLLRQTNDPALYEREGISSYGHLDSIFGARAGEDVFPHLIEFFERRQAAAGA
jgi:cholesterol oxidase